MEKESYKLLENTINTINSITKSNVFDSKTQHLLIDSLQKTIEILKSKSLERKKFIEYQPIIEEALYNFINSNKTTNNIVNSFIIHTYLTLFDFGLNTRINDFISKYSSLIGSSKPSLSVKQLAVWILGCVATKTMYISPNLNDMINFLIKQIKNNESNLQVKKELFKTLYNTLRKKAPSLSGSINDVVKLIIKQVVFPEVKLENLKLIDSIIFYINQNNFSTHYENIVTSIMKYFESDDKSVKEYAVKSFVEFLMEKSFDPNINLSKIMRRKITEPQKNFLEVLLCFGQQIIFEDNMNFNLKQSMIMTIKLLFEKFADFMNSSESLIVKVLDLMLGHYQILYSNFIDNASGIGPNSKVVLGNTNFENDMNRVAFELEEFYKTYIKTIYNSTYRQTLLKHIMKKLTAFQGKLDKLENFKIRKENIDFKVRIDKKTGKEIKEIVVKEGENPTNMSEKDMESNSQKQIGFNEGQINALLICLIEFSEHNYDIFEQVYPNFNDLSKTLLVYLASNIKAFRMLVNRVLINFAYFIPAYRSSILPLILNQCSVSHAELASLKNTCIYLVDESSNEYKYAKIVRGNLDLLKDVCNCLGVILSTFSHKSVGVAVDLSYASLSVAKNMIIGKFTDEEDNPKCLSVRERAKKYNFLNSDADFHKEAGWIIIQGLSSMDYTWLKNNFKPLFQLWSYVFNESSCEISDEDMTILSLPTNVTSFNSQQDKGLSVVEFKESFISEFFIRKSALAALRKFIISCYDFIHTKSFQVLVPKFLSHALNFFIENKKVSEFCKIYLKDNYKDLKVILYDCYFSIPINLYQDKFKSLLYSLTEDITNEQTFNSNVSNNNVFCEYIYNHLNYFDTLFCDYMLNPNFSANKITNIENINNMFHIDHFFLEKFNINLTNKLSNSRNNPNNSASKLIDSSINLLVEILMDENLNQKNKHQILKYFLTQVNDLSGKNFKETSKINKCLNIIYCCFLLLKKANKRGIRLITDESTFTNIKMIFDIGMKVENTIVKRISAEAHSLLIKLSTNQSSYLHYYLISTECKFKNESSLANEDGAFLLYLVANIFRTIEISELGVSYNHNNETVNILDSYVNLVCLIIAKTANKLENLNNPYASQSVLIISEALIKADRLTQARKIVESYKQNYLFIKLPIDGNEKSKDKDKEVVYFRDLLIRNYFSEVKLLMIYSLLGSKALKDEKEWFEFFMKKFIADETYKNNKIRLVFLYLAKISIANDNKNKENNSVIGFFKEKVFIDYLKEMISTYSFGKMEVSGPFYECKIAIEILIMLLLEEEKPNDWLTFIEKTISQLNVVYNYNRNPYFMNDIFSSTYSYPDTNSFLFFAMNKQNNIDSSKKFTNNYLTSVAALKKVYNIIDSNQENLNKTSTIISDAINPNYTLIKHFKLLLKIFIEKTILQLKPNIVMNFIKELTVNPITFYQQKKEGEGLTSMQEEKVSKKDSLSNYISINKMKHFMHINLKKYLIKQILNCVSIYIESIQEKLDLTLLNTKSSEPIMEIMNCFLNSCLNLIINSEEFFEIKQIGLDLLIKVINIFKKYPDTRADEYSLLIQQADGGITPCFKTIFNTKLSIKAAFSGFKILYKYLTIPIASDTSFLSKKLDNLIDLNCLKNKMELNAFSEKNEFLFMCKKLNLFCYLYLTRLGVKNLTLYCIQSLIPLDTDDIQIFHQKHKKFNDEIKSYFNAEKLCVLLNNLIGMLMDFSIIMTLERKQSVYYKGFNYLHSGNRITFSTKKVFKYSQLYIKTLSLLLNDQVLTNLLSNNQDLDDQIKQIIEKKLFKEDKPIYLLKLQNKTLDFKPIFEIVNFLTHYTGLKYTNNKNLSNLDNRSYNKIESDNSGDEELTSFNSIGKSSEELLYSNPNTKFMKNKMNSEVLVFSDNDISFNVKEKVVVKLLIATELADSIYLMLVSKICLLNVETIYYLLDYSLILLKLNNYETTCKIILILEKLSNKLYDDCLNDIKAEHLNTKNTISEEDYSKISKKILQVIFFYINFSSNNKDYDSLCEVEFIDNSMFKLLLSNQQVLISIIELTYKCSTILYNKCYDEEYFTKSIQCLLKILYLNKESTVNLLLISKLALVSNYLIGSHQTKTNLEKNKEIINLEEEDEFQDVEEDINTKNTEKPVENTEAKIEDKNFEFVNNSSKNYICYRNYINDLVFTIKLLMNNLEDSINDNLNANIEKVSLLIMLLFQQFKDLSPKILSELTFSYNSFMEQSNNQDNENNKEDTDKNNINNSKVFLNDFFLLKQHYLESSNNELIIQSDVLRFLSYDVTINLLNTFIFSDLASKNYISITTINKALLNIAKRFQASTDFVSLSVLEIYLINLINNWKRDYSKIVFNQELLGILTLLIHLEESVNKRHSLATLFILFINENTGLTTFSNEILGNVIVKLISKQNDVEILRLLTNELNKDLQIAIQTAYKLKLLEDQKRKEEELKQNKNTVVSKVSKPNNNDSSEVASTNKGSLATFKLKMTSK